jgi:hypothetical protein
LLRCLRFFSRVARHAWVSLRRFPQLVATSIFKVRTVDSVQLLVAWLSGDRKLEGCFRVSDQGFHPPGQCRQRNLLKCVKVQQDGLQYQSRTFSRSRDVSTSTLVTALIRYIYKGACKLLSGQASSSHRTRRPVGLRSSHDLRPQALSPLAHILISSPA